MKQLEVTDPAVLSQIKSMGIFSGSSWADDNDQFPTLPPKDKVNLGAGPAVSSLPGRNPPCPALPESADMSIWLVGAQGWKAAPMPPRRRAGRDPPTRQSRPN